MTLIWSRAAAAKSACLMGIGLVIWFIGWYLTAGRATTPEQIGPLNVAAVGLLIVGAGQLSWILEGRRAIGVRRVEVLGVARPTAVRSTETLVADWEGAGSLLPGGSRYYHRPSCAMAAGREAATWLPRIDHEAGGRIACGICAP